MKLLVIRHAEAEDFSFTRNDKDRPLSVKGQETFSKICKNLVHLNLKFDVLLDSPLLRSQQTADIFCKYFKVKQSEHSQNLKPSSQISDLILEIEAFNVENCVIIGHQPFLGRFVSHTLTDNIRELIDLKRGSMIFLNFPHGLKPCSATIEAVLTPKHFFKTD